MTALPSIKEKYASMPDSELIHFATEEGQYLTSEALSILKAELNARKLTAIVSNRDNAAVGEMAFNHYGITMQAFRSNAFDQKENGKSNEEILGGLIEAGADETEARYFVSNMEMIAELTLKKAIVEILTGGGIIACGIAINFLPLSFNSNRLTYIFAWVGIFFGIWRWIKGQYNKHRFKKIIKNIQTEKNAESQLRFPL